MIEFKCPTCGKYLKLPHSYAGKTAQCPGCLDRVPVPGGQADRPAPTRPKAAAPSQQLCVDCGGSFSTGDMLEHSGQLVCTDCYYKRKPVVLKYKKKRSKKRKFLLFVLILAAIGGAAWAGWYFFLR